MFQINYQHDIQVESNKYRYSQEELAAELHWAQLQLEKEDLELKKAVARQNYRQIEESGKRLKKELGTSSVHTQLEFRLKNKESEKSQLKINLELKQTQQKTYHEIGAALHAERLAEINQMHKDGISQEKMEKNSKIIFDA
ncbi:hypothetical protein O181_034947 [Austropuccinia psidii MF-1]|uniref:Uncharacterized protein n=1 Tax=Austropuccinia psidii MF-1 TaxID=1389203 RepID=A0A9Q3D498_9BASI|nr:hypothetical protein [Austropuccinia psidii MF-1]